MLDMLGTLIAGPMAVAGGLLLFAVYMAALAVVMYVVGTVWNWLSRTWRRK